MGRLDASRTPDMVQHLLDAADRVAMERGIGAVTLDAVAAAAGVSKGGLIHHFRNKDALLEAMVNRCVGQFHCDLRQRYDSLPPGPGRMIRAVVAHCVDDPKAWSDDLRRRSSVLFAALGHNPELVKSLRENYERIWEVIRNDGLPPGRGEMAMAVLDAVWLYWTFGISSPLLDRPDDLRRWLSELTGIDLTRPTCQDPKASPVVVPNELEMQR